MAIYKLKKSIVLIGSMGAGKSSIGKRVADEINVPFVDSDDEIESAAGMSVVDIFTKFGEVYFRAGEERVIERLLCSKPQIIATGGGSFRSSKIRKLVRLSAISVWLKADFDTLWTRVQGKGNRPLLKVTNPQQALQSLIKERTPFYENADIIVESKKNTTHSEMVSKLITALCNFSGLERLSES